MRERPLDEMPFVAPSKALRFGRTRAQFDTAILRVCARLLDTSVKGRLQLTLPSGASTTLGSATASAPAATLSLNSYKVFWRSLRRGSIGFAESYLAGEIRSDDLIALFHFFIGNRRALHRAGRDKFRVHGEDRAYHRGRANTRAGSRTNIAAHYDLGNDFYRLWLDTSLTYSSALYETPSDSLESAQVAKYQRILDVLEIAAGQRVLEIGCGWGALAARIAGEGAHVTALTLSHAQFDTARALLSQRGLAAQTEIRLEDYREATGTFDRVVSIEMIEAVGEEHWPLYFSTVRNRLAPGGIAVLQAITIDEAVYERYRAKADFIQRFIFPGGMLPSRPLVGAHAQAAGLDCQLVLSFGASYALTLVEWRRRFQANWQNIAALGFDDRFQRMWDYYLAYCQAGFEAGTIDVGLYRLTHAATPSMGIVG